MHWPGAELWGHGWWVWVPAGRKYMMHTSLCNVKSHFCSLVLLSCSGEHRNWFLAQELLHLLWGKHKLHCCEEEELLYPIPSVSRSRSGRQYLKKNPTAPLSSLGLRPQLAPLLFYFLRASIHLSTSRWSLQSYGPQLRRQYPTCKGELGWYSVKGEPHAASLPAVSHSAQKCFIFPHTRFWACSG